MDDPTGEKAADEERKRVEGTGEQVEDSESKKDK